MVLTSVWFFSCIVVFSACFWCFCQHCTVYIYWILFATILSLRHIIDTCLLLMLQLLKCWSVCFILMQALLSDDVTEAAISVVFSVLLVIQCTDGYSMPIPMPNAKHFNGCEVCAYLDINSLFSWTDIFTDRHKSFQWKAMPGIFFFVFISSK